MNPLAEAKEQQKEAAKHGRRTKLEAQLNELGLSLFAPPFGTESERTGWVVMNEYEAWAVPEIRTELSHLLDNILNAIVDMDAARQNPEEVHRLYKLAVQTVTNLAKHIVEQRDKVHN